MWEDNRMIRRAICLPKNLLWGKWRGNRICNAIPFFFWFHRNSVLFKRIFKQMMWPNHDWIFILIITAFAPVPYQFLKSSQKIYFDLSLILTGNLINFTFIPNEQCLCISLHAEFRPMELLLSLNWKHRVGQHSRPANITHVQNNLLKELWRKEKKRSTIPWSFNR